MPFQPRTHTFHVHGHWAGHLARVAISRPAGNHVNAGFEGAGLGVVVHRAKMNIRHCIILFKRRGGAVAATGGQSAATQRRANMTRREWYRTCASHGRLAQQKHWQGPCFAVLAIRKGNGMCGHRVGYRPKPQRHRRGHCNVDC